MELFRYAFDDSECLVVVYSLLCTAFHFFPPGAEINLAPLLEYSIKTFGSDGSVAQLIAPTPDLADNLSGLLSSQKDQFQIFLLQFQCRALALILLRHLISFYRGKPIGSQVLVP